MLSELLMMSSLKNNMSQDNEIWENFSGIHEKYTYIISIIKQDMEKHFQGRAFSEKCIFLEKNFKKAMSMSFD